MHYIHGSEFSSITRGIFNTLLSFMAQTLEFVFAASDLIEAGWDLKAWAANPTGMAHPFGTYRVEYLPQLTSLKGSFEVNGIAKSVRPGSGQTQHYRQPTISPTVLRT